MLHLKLKRKKANKKSKDNLGHEIKEIFVGRQTVFSLLSFLVGSILVGRSLWEYGQIYLGLPATIFIGLGLFIIGGALSGIFHK